MSFFTNLTVQVKVATCVVCEVNHVATYIQNQVASSYLLECKVGVANMFTKFKNL